ncbi:hypothetical protein CI594_14425, partial [Fischerella thermalis CCMEE 5196]
MKQTKLYIFVTSDVPDPYINVIAHCSANYSYLNQVTLVGITEDRGKIGSEADKLNRLKQNISNQLDSLSKGKYLTQKAKTWETLDIQIEPVERQRYIELKNIILETSVVDYQNLEQKISIWLNSTDSFEYIFDVTAVAKSYLVDVYTILRFKNICTIYSFELFKERDYDERDLIHNLTYRKTYAFTCLAESTYTRDRIVVSDEASIIAGGDFNRLQSDLKLLESNRNRLEDILATDFARFWSFFYFVIL